LGDCPPLVISFYQLFKKYLKMSLYFYIRNTSIFGRNILGDLTFSALSSFIIFYQILSNFQKSRMSDPYIYIGGYVNKLS
jgi:hypothetical protein